ncbi:MAG: helix-turn-helix domain-containing protein [Prevotella sp.]|nr:helix-turn-helix domain-containing protein [Prevotella sp.]
MDYLGLFVLLLVIVSVAVTIAFVIARAYYKRKYAPLIQNSESNLQKAGEQTSDMIPAADISTPPTEQSAHPTEQSAHATEQSAPSPDVAKPAPVMNEYNRISVLTDQELYKELTTAIRDKQMFLKPKFGRDDVVKYFGLTNHRVGAAFSAEGTSLPEFVRQCRLEYAIRLMCDHPEMPFTEVAFSSGFNYASTFNADFKKQYGLSPSQYRMGNLIKNK